MAKPPGRPRRPSTAAAVAVAALPPPAARGEAAASSLLDDPSAVDDLDLDFDSLEDAETGLGKDGDIPSY